MNLPHLPEKECQRGPQNVPEEDTAEDVVSLSSSTPNDSFHTENRSSQSVIDKTDKKVSHLKVEGNPLPEKSASGHSFGSDVSYYSLPSTTEQEVTPEIGERKTSPPTVPGAAVPDASQPSAAEPGAVVPSTAQPGVSMVDAIKDKYKDDNYEPTGIVIFVSKGSAGKGKLTKINITCIPEFREVTIFDNMRHKNIVLESLNLAANRTEIMGCLVK